MGTFSVHDSAHSIDDNQSDVSAEDEDYCADDVDQYCDLIDMVEAAEFSAAYYTEDYYSSFGDVSAALDDLMQPQSLSSPRKRLREHI